VSSSSVLNKLNKTSNESEHYAEEKQKNTYTLVYQKQFVQYVLY